MNGAKTLKDLYEKNNYFHSVMLEWFSLQLPVISEIFKLSLNLSFTHLRAQTACYELKGDLIPVINNNNNNNNETKTTRSCQRYIQSTYLYTNGYLYSAYLLTWQASMLICTNKRKFLHKKRVHFPQGCQGTPIWPLFYRFGTPIWPP